MYLLAPRWTTEASEATTSQRCDLARASGDRGRDGGAERAREGDGAGKGPRSMLRS